MIKIWITKEFPFFADYGTGMHDFDVTEHDWQTLRQKALRLSEMIATTKKEAYDMMHSYISLAEKGQAIAKLKEELTLAECAATVDFFNIKSAYAQRHLKHPLEDPQNIYFESRHDPQNKFFEAPRNSFKYGLSVVSDQFHEYFRLVSIGIPREQALEMAIEATNNKLTPPEDTQPQ